MVWRQWHLFICLALLGCGHKTIDTEAARKLSDPFMSVWIAHRADAAFDKMEPEFGKTVNRSDFTTQLEKLFQYCGWPQDSELKDVKSGYKAYADGHTNPTRKFIYAAKHQSIRKGPMLFLSGSGSQRAECTGYFVWSPKCNVGESISQSGNLVGVKPW